MKEKGLTYLEVLTSLMIVVCCVPTFLTAIMAYKKSMKSLQMQQEVMALSNELIAFGRDAPKEISYSLENDEIFEENLDCCYQKESYLLQEFTTEQSSSEAITYTVYELDALANKSQVEEIKISREINSLSPSKAMYTLEILALNTNQSYLTIYLNYQESLPLYLEIKEGELENSPVMVYLFIPSKSEENFVTVQNDAYEKGVQVIIQQGSFPQNELITIEEINLIKKQENTSQILKTIWRISGG